MYRRLSGFTVVELLIAIVIVALLAAVGVLTYSGIVKRTHTSSLRHDVQAMDVAQKRYMTQENSTPISYSSNGSANDTLAFIASKGNSIVVHLKPDSQYCIYGFNPGSSYPTENQPLIRSSSGASCGPMPYNPDTDQNGAFSTVTVVGQRLEAYYGQYSSYPKLDALADIGLVIKPNSGQANQQQLYCRNDTQAIYLQVEHTNDSVYVYVTASHSVTQPGLNGKISLQTICSQYGINEGDPGFQSTGIKNPDF